MRAMKVAVAIGLMIPAVHHTVLAQGVRKSGEQQVIAPRPAEARFTLTSTQNVWTFLLLDSSNGRLWQVQYSLSDSTFRGRLPINEDALIAPASAHPGRFIIQETQNIYNFLLLDQDDGRIWQVQWSNDADNRGVWVLSAAAP